jgi:hypothetical protein
MLNNQKNNNELIRNILRNVKIYMNNINDYYDRLEDDEDFEMPEIRDLIPKKKEVKKKEVKKKTKKK